MARIVVTEIEPTQVPTGASPADTPHRLVVVLDANNAGIIPGHPGTLRQTVNWSDWHIHGNAANTSRGGILVGHSDIRISAQDYLERWQIRADWQRLGTDMKYAIVLRSNGNLEPLVADIAPGLEGQRLVKLVLTFPGHGQRIPGFTAQLRRDISQQFGLNIHPKRAERVKQPEDLPDALLEGTVSIAPGRLAPVPTEVLFVTGYSGDTLTIRAFRLHIPPAA